MKKRLLAVLLCVCMTAACLPAVSAAGTVRETDFFEDQYHADVNYGDMKYEEMHSESFTAAAEAIRALLDDEANAARVEELFTAFTDDMQKLDTMYHLIEIRHSHDVTDEYAAGEMVRLDTVYTEAADALAFLIQDILKSPCGAFLRAQFSESEIEAYLSYGGVTEEQKALSARETQLTNQYDLIINGFTIEYAGEQLNEADAQELLDLGEITYDHYVEFENRYGLELADAVGGVYLELLDVRSQLARTCGYDSYVEYAYKEIYGRDYTPEEILDYEQAVKKNVPALEYQLDMISYYLLPNEIMYADYAGDQALDMIEPYIGRMSSELAETFSYMRDHSLYDTEASEYKDGTGFTAILPSYGAPFLFNTPVENLYDFTTAVHEFGHYNNFYWHPAGWNDESSGFDSAEVHSQGMELMFSHWYPEIFGEEGGQSVLDYLVYNLLLAISEGALFDEWQQYAYTTEDVTVEDLNAKCLQLYIDYGLIEEDDAYADSYSATWAYIPHNFSSPLYYISYSTSAAWAFAFWLDAQRSGDYYAALDEYLKFVALPASTDFQESFEQLGMENPVSPEYIEELCDAIYEAMDVEARFAALYADLTFSDVDHDAWYAEYVGNMVMYGLMEGTPEGEFLPEGTTTRAQAVTTLWRLDGGDRDGSSAFTDVPADAWYADAVDWAASAGVARGDGAGRFSPTAEITREQMAVMVYNTYHLGFDGAEPAALAFTDADQVSPWAVEAMEWCVANGIFQGCGDGALSPKDTLSRAELATVLNNLCNVILGGIAAYSAGPEPAAISAEPVPTPARISLPAALK